MVLRWGDPRQGDRAVEAPDEAALDVSVALVPASAPALVVKPDQAGQSQAGLHVPDPAPSQSLPAPVDAPRPPFMPESLHPGLLQALPQAGGPTPGAAAAGTERPAATQGVSEKQPHLAGPVTGDSRSGGQAPDSLAQYRMALLIGVRNSLRNTPDWQGPPEVARDAGTATPRFAVHLQFVTGELAEAYLRPADVDRPLCAVVLDAAVHVARALAPPAVLATQSFTVQIDVAP